MTTLSIVVPCYNEATGLESFYELLAGTISRDMDETVDIEMLFVDDGSTDGTLSCMKDLAQRDSRVRYLSLSRNFGKEAAIYAGLENASGDFVAVMDADGQDSPAELPRMFRAVQDGDCDMARMRRVSRAGEPLIRSFCARMFYRVINRISDTEIADGARDYQVMNRKVVDAILSVKEYNRFFKGITSWVGFRAEWFEQENVERMQGETKWGFWSLFRYAMDGVLAFSTFPLKIASGGGSLCFCLSLICIVYIVIRALLFGDPVPGWPSLICVILLIGGIQLLCVGILGQYLAKTYLETKRRPIYLVEETNVTGSKPRSE